MAYIDIYNLHQSANLRSRIAVAIAKAAEDVRNEAVTVPSHSQRFTWAIEMLSGEDVPKSQAAEIIWLVLQNATIQASGEASTDNDLQFVVNGLVNFMAGVDTAT